MIQKIGRSAQRSPLERNRSLAFESLESRELLTATSFQQIGNQSVAFDTPIHIGLDGISGQDITYTVDVDSPYLEARILTGNRSWKLDVQDQGTMIFEFFEGRAPRATGQFAELIEGGFYDGKEFIRVIDDFVIQATGATSPLEDFDDEFHLELNHSQYGTLSMAKAAEDDNNAEFFATLGPTPHLDYHHSVFGIITEGKDTLGSIGSVPVSGSTPVDPVVITSSELIDDTENGVLFLKALTNPDDVEGGDPLLLIDSIEVTVTATNGDGESFSETFEVSLTNDSSNGKPFLEAIPPIVASPGETVNVELNAFDAEGNDIIFFVPGYPPEFPFDQFNPVIQYEEVFETITPTGTVGNVDLPVKATYNFSMTVPEGFYGRFRMEFYVYGNESPATTPVDYSNYDRQIVIFDVKPETPLSVDLLASSDSGPSNTDNDTDLATLTFEVSGVEEGKTVKLFSGDTELGEAVVPNGQTSVQVTVDGAATLGQGAHSITARQAVEGDNYEDLDRFEQVAPGGQWNVTPITILSDASPALEMTYDRSLLGISPELPTSVVVTTPYTYDALHGKEGDAGFAYSVDGPAGMTIDSATGVITWTPTSDQVGSHTVTVTGTDQGGVEDTISATVEVALPTPASVDLLEDSDKGLSNADNITNQTTLDFLVSGVLPGLTVTLWAGNTAIGSEVVPAGETSVTVTTDNPGALTDGTHTITATQSMNPTSEASPSLDVTIDTVLEDITLNPPATFVIGPFNFAQFDAAHNEEGNSGFRYSVVSGPSSLPINILTGTVSGLPTVADAGHQTITVKAIDRAGNETEITKSIEFIPPAPTAVALDASSDSGASDSDRLTNHTTPSFTVSGVVPNATVKIFADGVEIGTATAPDGTPGDLQDVVVATTNSVPLTEGTHTITATHGFDTPSSPSGGISVEFDFTPAEGASGDAPADAVVDDTVTFDPTNPMEGEPGYSYSLGAAPDGMMINSSTGAISWNPTNDQIGEQSYTINVVDPAGNVTATVFSTTVAPLPPDSIDLLPESDSGASDSDDLTNQTTLSFLVSGVLPGATVTLFAGSTEIGSADVPEGESTVVVTTTNPGGLAEGANSITATQTVNPTSAISGELVVTIDTTDPDAITPSLPTTATAGVPYIYDVDEGSTGHAYSLVDPPTGATIDAATGELTWTPSADQAGNQTITVKATDDAGNETTLSDTVDVTPLAPAGIDLLPGSDSGSSDSDDLTNLTTLSFLVSGVLPGATVTLFAGSTEIGSVEVQPGESTVVVTTANLDGFVEGLNSITARQTVNSTSAASGELVVEIDTTAPGAISPVLPTTATAGDPYEYDAVHSEEGDPGFSYSLVDPPTDATIDAATGEITWTPSNDQIGDQSVTVKATDAAGNETTISDTIVVDPSAPTAVDLLPGSDSGASDSDDLTNQTTLSFLVSGVLPGATVTLFAGSTEIGSAEVQAGESTVVVTTTNPAGLVEGLNSITATQTVNPTSAASGELVVTIDTTPPADFVVPLPSTAVAGIPYEFNAANPEEGATGFVYSLDNPPVGATIDEVTGVISWLPEFQHIAGPQQINVVARDAAGNETSATQTVIVELPTGPPAGVDLLDGSDSGASNIDDVTNVTTPTFRVNAVAPGTTVKLFADGMLIAESVVPSGQVFVDMTPAAPLAEGMHAITATQTGNVESDPSVALAIEIDTTAPDAITPNLPATATTGVPFSYDVDEGSTGHAYSLVDPLPNMSIDAVTGEMSWTPSADQVGDQVITVMATDVAGNATTISSSVEVIPPAPTAIVLDTASDSGASDSDRLTNQVTPSFTVSGVIPNATVTIFADGIEIGSATAANGTPGVLQDVVVTTTNSVPLTDGSHTITATQAINTSSSVSVGLAIEIDTTAPDAITPDLPATATAGLQYEYDAQNPEENVDGFVYELENPLSGMTFDTNTGILSWTPTNAQSGSQDITIKGRDLAGNETSTSQTVEVTPAAPTAIDLLPDSDTGTSNTDDLTNLTTLSFLVSGVTSGATVTLFVGGTAVGSEIVSQGETTVVVTTDNPEALSEGENSFTATQTVNPTSAASDEFVVTIDTTAPEAITPALPLGVIFGTSFAYNAENAEEGSDGFAYSLVDPPTGMTIDSATGEVSWTPTAGQIGNPEVTIVATDAAGNQTTISGTVEVTPPAPTSIDLLPGSDSGTSDSDDLTNQTTLSFLVSGVLPGATVTLFAGATDIGSAMVEAGETTVIVTTDNPEGLVEGVNSITATQTVNPTSDVSSSLEVTIDTIGPGASTPALPTTGTAGIAYVYDAENAEEGTAGFSYSLENPPAGMTIVAATGALSWTPASEQIGNQTVTINATDAAGNQTTVLTGVVEVTPAVVNVPIVIDEDQSFFQAAGNSPLFELPGDVQGISGRLPGLDLNGSFIQGPANGDVVVNGDGTFDYIPFANFDGIDFLSYRSYLNGIVNVFVAVKEVNDLPFTMDDEYIVDQASIGNILAATNNDGTAPDVGESLTIANVNPPSQGGTATVSADGKNVVYTPKPGFAGTETIGYTVDDGRGGQTAGSITVVVDPILTQNPISSSDESQTIFLVDTSTKSNNGNGGGTTDNIGVQSTFVPAETQSKTNPNYLDGGGNGVFEANRATYQTVYKIFTEIPDVLNQTVERLNKGSGLSITAAEAAAALQKLEQSLGSDGSNDAFNELFESENAAVQIPAGQTIEGIIQSGGSSVLQSLPAEFWTALEEALQKILDTSNNDGTNPQASVPGDIGTDGAVTKLATNESSDNETDSAPNLARLQSLQDSQRSSIWTQVVGSSAVAGTFALGRRKQQQADEQRGNQRPK